MVVRTLIPSHFKAPWGFAKKGAKGLRKIGPMHYESWKWPGQNKEFPELSPKWQKNNRMELRRLFCYFFLLAGGGGINKKEQRLASF